MNLTTLPCGLADYCHTVIKWKCKYNRLSSNSIQLSPCWHNGLMLPIESLRFSKNNSWTNQLIIMQLSIPYLWSISHLPWKIQGYLWHLSCDLIFNFCMIFLRWFLIFFLRFLRPDLWPDFVCQYVGTEFGLHILRSISQLTAKAGRQAAGNTAKGSICPEEINRMRLFHCHYLS